MCSLQCMAVWCLFITFTCNCITVQTVRVLFYFPLRLVTFCLLFMCFLFATSSRYCAKLLNKPIDYSIIEFGFYLQYLICTGYALSLSLSPSLLRQRCILKYSQAMRKHAPSSLWRWMSIRQCKYLRWNKVEGVCAWKAWRLCMCELADLFVRAIWKNAWRQWI